MAKKKSFGTRLDGIGREQLRSRNTRGGPDGSVLPKKASKQAKSRQNARDRKSKKK